MEPNREEVWKTIVQVLGGLGKEGIDAQELRRDSRLSEDLGFSSVDSIHMMISLEDAFKQPLGLEKVVIKNGEYTPDLSLGSLCDHICESLRVAD